MRFAFFVTLITVCSACDAGPQGLPSIEPDASTLHADGGPACQAGEVLCGSSCVPSDAQCCDVSQSAWCEAPATCFVGVDQAGQSTCICVDGASSYDCP